MRGKKAEAYVDILAEVIELKVFLGYDIKEDLIFWRRCKLKDVDTSWLLELRDRFLSEKHLQEAS